MNFSPVNNDRSAGQIPVHCWRLGNDERKIFNTHIVLFDDEDAAVNSNGNHKRDETFAAKPPKQLKLNIPVSSLPNYATNTQVDTRQAAFFIHAPTAGRSTSLLIFIT